MRGTRLMLAGAVMLGWSLVIHLTSADGHWTGLVPSGLLGAACLLAGIALAVAQRG